MRLLGESETRSHIDNISEKGYSVIEGLLDKYEVAQALSEVRSRWERVSRLEKNFSEHSKIVFGLETMDRFFLSLLMQEPVKTLLMHYVNDPYFGVLPGDAANYHIGYFVARSGMARLPAHLDSYIPYQGEHPIIIQLLFALEQMTDENGCTYVIPGSHKFGEYPDQEIDYDTAQRIMSAPGDVVIWDSRIWHGSEENRTSESRWALIATIMRWWIKPRLDATRNISREYYQSLSVEEKALLGFCSIPPHDTTTRVKTRIGYENLLENPADFYPPFRK